jgi:hypothetical protein
MARDFEKFMGRFLEIIHRGCTACDHVARCLKVGSPECHYSDFDALDRDIQVANLESALSRKVWQDSPLQRIRWAFRKLRDAIRLLITW